MRQTPRHLTTLLILAITLGALGWASPVLAQTPVQSPNWVEFDVVAAEHPTIVRYELGFFNPQTGAEVQVAAIGTGTPVGTRLTLAMPQNYPTGVVYVGRVRGVAIVGNQTLVGAWSEPSNTFTKSTAPVPPAAPGTPVIRR